MAMKKRCFISFVLIFTISFFLTNNPLFGQSTEKKVVLQGFWWDYWNNNFPNSWADYLAELAPRLKALDIDAVWIPPSYKNAGTGNVGYTPFDHYDLGDKYQKGTTTTRFGDKDAFLRMVAIFHANGIEVIQDVVLNHVADAGAVNGQGGQDPELTFSMATNNGYKNFRYVCYDTPVPELGENATEYLSRTGRWPKNYPNFHPHLGHNDSSGDWASPYWGPDFCYGTAQDGTANGYGQSSNATYNPIQAYDYNRDQARNWIKWFVKQTDVDGFRWDAVKHFPYFVLQDLSWNVKYANDWAGRGESMYNVGEYVGGASELDTWVNNVKNSNNGNDELAGTFDFSLRGAVYNMVTGNGTYDIGSIPSAQQSSRVTYYSGSNTYVHRTVPFVNNHDTFRPTVDSYGNYTGWDTGNELAAHVHPEDGRLSAAYAIIFAVDGNPMVFFEDLFNIGSTSKRWSHEPTNTTDLPVNEDLLNIIWCHQNLDFKSGEYLVRWQAGDLLIIERSGKALIVITDNWDTWQGATVQTNFANGTELIDYSGANTGSKWVNASGQVEIYAPPCNGTANFGRRGYAIYAPAGITGTYQPSRNNVTTQEWEMENDLGDIHCSSLRQGGKLPDNSTEKRIAGKIFVESGQDVDYILYPENSSNSLTVGLFNLEGTLLDSESGTGTLTGNFTTSSTGWIVIKANNTSATYLGQKCWIKVSYQAPQVVDTDTYPAHPGTATWTGNVDTDASDCHNWQEEFTPRYDMNVLIPTGAPNMPVFASNLECQELDIESNASLTVNAGTQITVNGDFTLNGTLLLRTYGGSQATLLDNGTITGTGNLQVEQYLIEDQWHYISSPVSAQTAQFLNGAYMKTFDESNNNWGPYISSLSTVLTPQQGYAVWLTTSVVATYDGFPNTQAVGSYMVQNTTKITDGYNFIGNPFPSAIDWDATNGWNNQNLGSQIWMWNPTFGQYGSYVAGNNGVGTNDASNIIPVGQGFFVQATAAGSVQMDNRIRQHNNASTFKSTTVEDILKLKVSSASGGDECLVSFRPYANHLYDETYDAEKWMTSDTTKPSLYTIAGGIQLSNNTMGSLQGSIDIPLSFVPGSENYYQLFSFYDESFDATISIFLEDLFTTQFIDLRTFSNYSFAVTSNPSTDRFVLHFNSLITEMQECELFDFSCYVGTNYIHIEFNKEITDAISISLFDLQGRLLTQMTAGNKSQILPKPLASGIYLIHITESKNTLSKKVFID
ncbi:MAG: T9SS type A sorting domain-containing protein [Bacteroidales bacterium]|nr:T9SS type A sorting domain-containing protein [Bacteroidales bacterium]MCF8457792.1 T9SS type A sorting domain-containing protein [Bacteroidales bacterium]